MEITALPNEARTLLVLLFCRNARLQPASMKRYVNVDFGFELLYPAEYGSTYLPYNVAVMCANDGLESLLYVSAGTSQEAGSSGFAAISTLRTEDTSSP